MKKGKNKSDPKIPSVSEVQLTESFQSYPLDVLTVKVLSLRLPEKEPMAFAINITFFDQLILDGIINSSWARKIMEEEVTLQGSMNYDPSDYEKMCLFADTPLIVMIEPVNVTRLNSSVSDVPKITYNQSTMWSESNNSTTHVSGCNVDILPMFLDTDVMCVRVRLQPVKQTSVLNAISWDNLPLLVMELSVKRDALNVKHHDLLAAANFLKLTLIGCYNLPIPYNEDYIYTAATNTTMFNDQNVDVINFNNGYRSPKGFLDTSFNPKWESVRLYENVNAASSEKFDCDLNSIQNDIDIDIEKYLTESNKCYNTIWASFHRTLMLKQTELWLSDFLRQYQWPFELNISGSTKYCLMAFLDLFKLLYPGEDTVRIAVPLQWLDESAMKQRCNCDSLFTPSEQAPSTTSGFRKPSKLIVDSTRTSKTDTRFQGPTGYDGNCAFVIVEVNLRYPFKKPVIPRHVPKSEIQEMLEDMETQPCQRECTGRGQLIRDWRNTVNMAANALRRIPYYGSADFCTFDRQLSSTRTRVEIVTSFCEEAAIYVNNNFIAKEFLQSDDTYEEMLMMAHACLIRDASDTLLGVEDNQKINALVRAARHARHFQDTYHALELYFQFVAQNSRDADRWRELATCLQDIDQEWADVCLDKSLMLNPRHPLTLLSKGCMVLQRNPDAAETFFLSLILLHPFWIVGLVAANAYYIKIENFAMADTIMDCVKKTQAQALSKQLNIPRAWEHELGDWWDTTPLHPGSSLYYDAADLLLRIRGVKLAEVCLAQALLRSGESPAYFHLLALCCRLNGDLKNALCHIQEGIQTFGEIRYLRTLEAECYHTQRNVSASKASFDNAGTASGSYSILLSMLGRSSDHSRSVLLELLRRQPSAYAWMALADDWIASSKENGPKAHPSRGKSSVVTYAIACAIEALKIDKQAGRAWALLSRLVKPAARKQYCKKMAVACGFNLVNERMETSHPRPASCLQLSKSLRECRCKICNYFTL